MRNNNMPILRLENGSLALTLDGKSDGGFCLWFHGEHVGDWDGGQNGESASPPKLGLSVGG